MAIEDAEKLLLELYGLSRDLPLHDFQAHALRLLRPHLDFCSAIWGEGRRSPLGLAPHRLHSHDVDPEAVARWSEIIRLDKVIPIVLANLGKTMPFHAPSLFNGRGDSVMREYAEKYGRQSYMVTNIPTHHRSALEWISLYRPDPDAHFTPREQSFCERLMPHFHQALQINRTLHGLEALCEETDAQSHFALVDHAGFIYFAQPGFLKLLQKEWSQLDDFFVPDTLMAASSAAEDKPFIGRRIRCDRQPTGDLILLRAKPTTQLDRLSRRQHEIAHLYAAGHSHKEIALRLRIAPATVRNHLAAIYRVLAISTKAELIVLAQ